ncbi:Carbohydrate-selective porin, OprB family [Pseudidiomarina planktonica]|uniref:Carbohydrate-selective porin, OprB family n=1 Tax=Pseudidiomarina planktonica TaxID=1323738 RepID=A0A1Y6E893_9GAMM|nr:carbohydrate porin [Pseudidiomarina planktonica]SMQ58848.1 Carbohydrate-selective porin, OprB family [Pseudidiomarina planktonica]
MPLIKAIFGIVLATAAGHAVAGSADWNLNGNAVLIHQSTNEINAETEFSASGDLVITRQLGSGEWLAHVEASSAPTSDGVSSVYPEVNEDAGSALDKNNNGRIQLSELYYTHSFRNRQSVSLGLIDLSGLFDQSQIASDETTQFLGSSFARNITIEFPDYTLGVVHNSKLSSNLEWRSAIASSNGLADNPERSYSELARLSADGKGMFGITSASWQANEWLFRAGAWLNTADHQSLDMTEDGLTNYGAYALAEYARGQHAVNVRVGAANADTSQAAKFASIAYRYQWDKLTTGVAFGRTFESSKLPGSTRSDTNHYELFLRYNLMPSLQLTGDVQRFQSATVMGVRLTWLYQ